MRKLTKNIIKGSASIAALALGYHYCYRNHHLPMTLTAQEKRPTYTLEHAQLVFRHGARTPVCTYDIPGVKPAVWDPEKFSGSLPHTNVNYKLKLLPSGEEVDVKDVDPTERHSKFLNVCVNTRNKVPVSFNEFDYYFLGMR